MLGPHDRVHRELGLGGLAVEETLDLGELVISETELAVQGFRHVPIVPADAFPDIPPPYNAKNPSPERAKPRKGGSEGETEMPPKKMTAEHKKALAEGRAEGRAVKAYLDALDQQRPRRGRRRTPDSIKKRLAVIDKEIASASSLQRLQLVQERRDLDGELAGMSAKTDLTKLEGDFVKVAKTYSQRKGIEYASWRELGVSADVLKRAGVSRSAS
jgi:hypothetical protein